MRSRSRKDDTSVLATIDGNTSFGSKRRNNKNGRRRRSGGRRSSLSIESCGDEMLDEVTSLLDDGCENNNTTTNGRRIVFEDDDDDEEENYLEPLQNVKCNNDDISKKKKKKKKSSLNGKIRKRRRSSAVFLRLSGRFGGSEHDDPNNRNGGNQEQLGEMYRQAIKMNAENKLNATNSWGFNFIENMHKFLGDEEVDTTTTTDTTTSMKTIKEETSSSSGTTKRVNFTKASCTLDASVKIYSYRVDDVHLSSYKVLANLNRTDNGKKNNNNNTNNDDDGETNIDNKHKSSSRSIQSKSGCTLERNMANINMNKLDSAYDIDPLFHQMSQKFDEGGAKGLLLVNLGVAADGCRIVLDSKEDSQANIDDANTSPSLCPSNDEIIENVLSSKQEKDQTDDNHTMEEHQTNCNSEQQNEGSIDISCLSQKLQELLLCSPIDTLQLVPQLENLRTEYKHLEAEGFVDEKIIREKSRRYKVSSEKDEKEAEEYIHREALERSRASALNTSMGLNMSFGLNMSLGLNTSLKHSMISTGSSPFDNLIPADSQSHAADDYGDANDDYDYDDNGDAFDNYVDANNSDPLINEFNIPNNLSTEQNMVAKSSTAVVLDALCESDAFVNGGEYEYFSLQALEKITKGNLWAGSTHWKKTQQSKNKITTEESDETRTKRKRDTEVRSYVDFFSNSFEQLESLINQNCISKEKSESLLLSNAVKQKQARELNLLPPDAGIGIEQFSKLFLRPKAKTIDAANSSSKERKTVGFHSEDMLAYDNGDDDFHDNDYDDGPGFEFAEQNANFTEKDDYVVNDLKGVRKVDKVFVEHATVAKKVDVRKLKKDLWSEVDQRTTKIEENDEMITESDPAATISTDREADGDEVTTQKISFQNTVGKLDPEQSQNGVTISFYFICMLHLANEKCLKLENCDNQLTDFLISND